MAYDLTETFNFNGPISIDTFKSKRQDLWTGKWAGVLSLPTDTVYVELVEKLKDLPTQAYYVPDEYDKRPDRLAQTFYGSFEFTLIVLLQTDTASWAQFNSRQTVHLAKRADIETILIRN